MRRFVDDNFKATEYNLTVGHASSIPSLDNFSLDDYYNQTNLSSGWFAVQKNIDKYSVTKIFIPLMRKLLTSLLPGGL